MEPQSGSNCPVGGKDPVSGPTIQSFWLAASISETSNMEKTSETFQDSRTGGLEGQSFTLEPLNTPAPRSLMAPKGAGGHICIVLMQVRGGIMPANLAFNFLAHCLIVCFMVVPGAIIIPLVLVETMLLLVNACPWHIHFLEPLVSLS